MVIFKTGQISSDSNVTSSVVSNLRKQFDDTDFIERNPVQARPTINKYRCLSIAASGNKRVTAP